METKAATGDLNVGGVFKFEHFRDGKKIDEWETKNQMTDEGLDHVLDVTVGNGTQISTWYVGLFKGNYTPDGSETGANVNSKATEATEYTLGTHVTYVDDAVSGQSISNTTTKASFTINATVTVYGAFLTSDSGKPNTTGTVLCISRFPASRDLVNLDELLVTYTLSASDVV
mgnify:CR=1 FL=1